MEEKILVEADFEYDKTGIIVKIVIGLFGIIVGVVLFGFLSLVSIPSGVVCLYEAYKLHIATKQKLVITNSGIYGSTTNEEFNLPISKIITVNKVKNKGFTVAISSQIFKFYSCANTDDVYNTLIALTKDDISIEQKPSNIMAIKEYKELLDMGVITYEEFEAKKKELLNL